jgi:hypothetical protein
MMNGYSDLQKTDISSENINIPATNTPRYYQTRLRFVTSHDGSIETLCKILRRLSRMDLPGKDYVEAYLRHLTLRNRRPRTLESRCGAIVIFLGMLRDSGKRCLEEVTKRDVEAFIEFEQERGNKITTIRTSLVSVQAFLRYLVEEEVVSADIFSRRIRLQLPERLLSPIM